MEIIKHYILKESIFLKRKSIWLPTIPSICILLFVFIAPSLFWFLNGERILSGNVPVAEDILIVDGWIGEEPIGAIDKLLPFSKYKYIVAAGGYTGESWTIHRWSQANIASFSLRNLISSNQILLVAQAPDSDRHRSYVSAAAVKALLECQKIPPKTITIYTRGCHAFRSRMLYKKVFGDNVQVGVVSWKQPGTLEEPWWHSSTRSEDLLKETVGCLWEWIFDSGR